MSLSNALMQIRIDLKDRELLLYQDDQLVRRYPVKELKESLPTGKFTIEEKSICSPDAGIGTRWLGFCKQSLGIHGTSTQEEKEQCLGISLDNVYVEELFCLAPIGTQVELTRVPAEFQNLARPNQFGRFPATPLAFPVVAGPRSYIIQKGDTIWKLSRRYKLTMESILAANLLPDPNYLEPGQIINLPLPWPKK